MNMKLKGIALTQIALAIALGSVATIGTIAYFNSTNNQLTKEQLVDTIVQRTTATIASGNPSQFNLDGTEVNIIRGFATMRTTDKADCIHLGSRFSALGTVAANCERNELVFTPITNSNIAVNQVGLPSSAPEGPIVHGVGTVDLSGSIGAISNTMPPADTSIGSFTATRSAGVGNKALSPAITSYGTVQSTPEPWKSAVVPSPATGTATINEPEPPKTPPIIGGCGDLCAAHGGVSGWWTGKWMRPGVPECVMALPYCEAVPPATISTAGMLWKAVNPSMGWNGPHRFQFHAPSSFGTEKHTYTIDLVLGMKSYGTYDISYGQLGVMLMPTPEELNVQTYGGAILYCPQIIAIDGISVNFHDACMSVDAPRGERP